MPPLESVISTFGAAVKSRLSNPVASGQPEDQLRGPLEVLISDLAEIVGISRSSVVMVGESSLADLKTRPDYAVTVGGTLTGFIEIKAPGKGGDPRKFRNPHDKAQWERLSSLPNLIYTDGNAFSLWQSGELVGSVVQLDGDIQTAGAKLGAPIGLLNLFENFLQWEPISPRNARELAQISARLCRFLRDEVTEQLSYGSEALTALATDWRKLLFPDATNERFADGYAQAVTFGLLMARARGISLDKELFQVAKELKDSSTLIGAALSLLTDNAENQTTLKTSLGTLTRVLGHVDWQKISQGHPDAWLYFYEDFLEVYDNHLRKQTGSYYTPPEVVKAMVRMVDDLLKSPKYSLHIGLASPSVTLVDPATGTGTFLLGVLRKIAQNVEADEGAGSVAAAIDASIKRLVAFEMQLGPYAVAQLRMLAEIVELTGVPTRANPRMFVTNTLGNPDDDESWIPGLLAPIAQSRKEANKIKREESVTVVIGNPPYKDKAKGLGGWIEGQAKAEEKISPLARWAPPKEWGVGAHAKHLRNLYIYFWRWATWKVFDYGPGSKNGVICFITAAGFLGGLGFQKMRDYLRRACDDIWVIDCSPEGQQPPVNSRIFQGVQQPVCIVLASRSSQNDPAVPATVRFWALPESHRDQKFEVLAHLQLYDPAWVLCPQDWRAPFLPTSIGAWGTYPRLEDLFAYSGSGVMTGRTWIIAPDAESLRRRWSTLIAAPAEKMDILFHPHLKKGKKGELGDRHSHRIVKEGLAGFPVPQSSIADQRESIHKPIMYGFRSFDRQQIIPDSRVINRPNPELWKMRSEKQLYLTAPSDRSPRNGPALSFTSNIPDLHHYNGHGGRVFPLWQEAKAKNVNFPPHLLTFLEQRLKKKINPDDFMAYIAAVAAHPAFTARFQDDLKTPGLRIPRTENATFFTQAVDLGKRVIWLHTFGERMTDPDHGRPLGPPRLPEDRMPRIPASGAIPSSTEKMPNTLQFDTVNKRLLVGEGYVDRVEPAVWDYEVSGKQVLTQWFSYRKKDRNRPSIGDKRPPSPLGDIQPDHWLPEYTTELLNVLNILGLLVDLEPVQSDLLGKICDGPLISEAELKEAGALEIPVVPKSSKRNKKQPEQRELF